MTKLEEYLKSNGISRWRLAKDAGLDIRTVSALCRGTSDGKLSTWRLIADTLGCKLSEIMEM